MKKGRLEEDMHLSSDIIETGKEERHWTRFVGSEVKAMLALSERELSDLVYYCQEQWVTYHWKCPSKVWGCGRQNLTICVVVPENRDSIFLEKYKIYFFGPL